MESRSIRTDAGELDLAPVTSQQLQDIARYWPMGLLDTSDTFGFFGLVFQHGEQEVYGVKMQPADLSHVDARKIHHVNRTLIAAALPYYLEKQHRGVMVPCAYYKEKAAGMVESGMAFFVGPDAPGESGAGERAKVMYDDRLGDGATPMVFDMALAIGRASREIGLPLMTVIGMDLRPRLAMGGLAMHFLIEGPQVFVIKDPLQEDEPIWESVVRAGFSKLPYAPMRPTATPGSPEA